MTWKTIADIVSLFYPQPLAPELFADMATRANNELFALRWSERDMDALRKFRVVMGEDTTALKFTAGVATLPSDYFSLETGYYMDGHSPVRINFVSPRAFDAMITSAIEYPTLSYPIASIISNTVRIRPVEVKFVVFTYISSPQPVVYAVTSTRGFPEFDEANSSVLLWDDANVVVLIQNLLQNLNIQVSQTEIQNKLK